MNRTEKRRVERSAKKELSGLLKQIFEFVENSKLFLAVSVLVNSDSVPNKTHILQNSQNYLALFEQNRQYMPLTVYDLALETQKLFVAIKKNKAYHMEFSQEGAVLFRLEFGLVKKTE